MDTCFIIDQIKENLFDEREILERLSELKQVNKNLEIQYTINDIENAKSTFQVIRQKLSSKMEITPLYLELFKEIDKFLKYQEKQINQQQTLLKMEVETQLIKDFEHNQNKDIFIDQLNNISRHLNRSKKSISILDFYGNFLIYDKLAKDQFEHIYRNLEKDTFFERILKESNSKIQNLHGQDLCKEISKNQNKSLIIKYTIFSEKSRKKFNKELDIRSSKLLNVNEITNLIDLNSFEDIYFAYLQCLTSNLFIVDLSLTEQALLDLASQEQLDVNKKFIEKIQSKKQQNVNFKAIMLITRLSKNRQNLSISSIKKETIFQKFQGNFISTQLNTYDI
ncbi:hypothetical protein TTHERM_00219320 (macronuclear) [Tetrahymena thermophila SB210]|uniref:Uncharacterized protein n=1 Tax=Tetrahymena thermophila (strain SB210) TaxID=312017 RepID=I7LVY8_TETTS|nr:hypothetical protein TTHERM_00219320 [Tetrahymena thermophila SB210]EAS00359.1 hypothetical protein TTHERM_00219320 [Tetrahymena thermophila SB210]|eukprot:XP_001020604.1 hypothetical protein TTHERM_00219320 [Tetrahymena thermophila SB210]